MTRRKFKRMGDEQIQILLELCSVEVTLDQIVLWSDEDRRLVENWVGSYWLKANDNLVRVPLRPACLPL